MMQIPVSISCMIFYVLFAKGHYVYRNEICLPNVTISWELNSQKILSDKQKRALLGKVDGLTAVYNKPSASLDRDLLCQVSWRYVRLVLEQYKMATLQDLRRELYRSEKDVINTGNESVTRNILKMRGISEKFLIAFKFCVENIVRQRQTYCKNFSLVYDVKKGSCVGLTHENKRSRSNKTENRAALSSAMFSMSIIGNTLSVIFLFILLLTYIRFCELHNLQGKIVLLLSGTLLFATGFQVLELFSRNLTTICTATAILLHWSYLASLFWMGVIAFDLFISFPSRQKTVFFTKEDRFFAYLIAAFGVPSLVIIACSVLNFSEKNLISYGGGSTCLIYEFWANLFGLILPAGLVLVLNTVFILLTISLLRVAQSNLSILSQSNNWKRETLRMALTILSISYLIILGWILRFVGQVTGSVVLLCFATFTSSFQGVFVFIGFVYSKRLWRLWERKLFSSSRKYSDHRGSSGCASLADNDPKANV